MRICAWRFLVSLHLSITLAARPITHSLSITARTRCNFARSRTRFQCPRLCDAPPALPPSHCPSSPPQTHAQRAVGLGGSKKKKSKEVDPAQISGQIAKLKGTIEILDQKEKLVNKKIKGLKEQARIKAKGIGQRVDRAGALNLLKQVKMQEKMVARNGGMQLNLHQQIATLENALVNVDVLKAQMESTNMLKQVTASANIEDVDDMMLDMEDTLAQQDEMADALARPMAGMGIDDDDDLMVSYYFYFII